jgi:hypothetical protein
MYTIFRASKLLGLPSDLIQPAPPSEFPRCAHCGDVVGVYEPYMVVLKEGPDPDPTPPAADPLDAHGVLETYHRACYETFATSRD